MTCGVGVRAFPKTGECSSLGLRLVGNLAKRRGLLHHLRWSGRVYGVFLKSFGCNLLVQKTRPMHSPFRLRPYLVWTCASTVYGMCTVCTICHFQRRVYSLICVLFARYAVSNDEWIILERKEVATRHTQTSHAP